MRHETQRIEQYLSENSHKSRLHGQQQKIQNETLHKQNAKLSEEIIYLKDLLRTIAVRPVHATCSKHRHCEVFTQYLLLSNPKETTYT